MVVRQAWQQVLNKDIEYKSYSKSRIEKRRLEQQLIGLQAMTDALMSSPNGINANVVGSYKLAR